MIGSRANSKNPTHRWQSSGKDAPSENTSAKTPQPTAKGAYNMDTMEPTAGCLQSANIVADNTTPRTTIAAPYTAQQAKENRALTPSGDV